MKESVPRLRVFIGPNGSGKSTIALRVLGRYPSVFVNADEIEAKLSADTFRFDEYMPGANEEHFQAFIRSSPQFELSSVDTARILGDQLRIEQPVDSYFAATVADYLRTSLLEQGSDFAFESVFSHHSKLGVLRTAGELGFRVYLYVVCTEDPEINVGRVLDRVSRGGHAVSAGKVVERYERFLNLLPTAIEFSDRAYFFDNSAENSETAFFAEYDGETASIDWKEEWVPGWFVSSFPALFPEESSND